MKKFLTLLLLSLVFIASRAQQLEWAKTTGGPSFHIYPQAIANDLAGTSYVVVGYFDGTIDLDPGAGDSTVTSAGGNDIFIQRFRNDGSLIWAYRIGGTGDDQAMGVEIDDNGFIYFTGKITGTVDFDFSGLYPWLKTSAGGSDVFYMQLDSSANAYYVNTMGGAGDDWGTDVDQVMNGSSVVVVGAFSGTADMDPGAPVLNITSNGGTDAFVYRASSGFGIYAYGYGSTGTDIFNAAYFNYDGWVSVTGSFEGTVDFDKDAGESLNLTSNGSSDIVMMNFHQAAIGTPNAWNFGGSAADAGLDVVTDSFTTTYLTGYFNGTSVDFDASIGTAFPLTSAGGTDVFLLAQDRYGSPTYAKRIGNLGDDKGEALCLTKAGTLYLGGLFIGSTDLDPGAGTFYAHLPADGAGDAFMEKLDAAGNFIWAGGIQSAVYGYDNCKGVARSSTDELLACGYFGGTPDFDPSPATDTRAAVSSADMFVLKWSGCTPTTFSTLISACESYNLNGTTYYASGIYTQTLTNYVGCDSIITLTLNLHPVDISVTQSGSVLLAAGIDMSSYQWVDCATYSPVAGATSFMFTIPDGASYAAILTNIYGCIDTTACYMITGRENVLNNSITISPNPTSGVVTLHATQALDQATLEVRDLAGRLISSQVIHQASSAEVEISGVSGLYFITVREGDKCSTFKVVRE